MIKRMTTDEAIRAMNELEVDTTFLSDTDGYSARRLSLVHRPGFITRPVVFRVRLKERQFDETDRVTKRDFDVLSNAVRFYNTLK